MEEVKPGGVLNPAFQGDGAQYQRNVAQQTRLELAQNKDGVFKPEEDKEIVIEDCGVACLRLGLLNWFRSPKWFLVFLSWAACVQGICINGLVNVVITTIERRFGLQSTQTGMIASSYDIGSLVIMIPVTYLGGRLGSNKPRWIAAGLLIMGLGSLTYTLPHFITGPYISAGGGLSVGETQSLCGDEGEDLGCGEGGEPQGLGLASYRFVFVFAQLLHGVGAAPLITLGTTFLDDSVNRRSAPLYIAVFQTWFVIGPAIGYVMGGQLLSLHTDLVRETDITPASSLWVGAWWPGFLITGTMAFMCAACILLYPSHINRKVPPATVTNKSSSSLSALPSALVSLLTNPTYLLVSVSGGIDGMVTSGLAAFLPKFIEQQYQLTNGLAAQVVGLIIVPAGGGGTFFGGWLIKRLNLSRHGVILMCFLFQILTIPTVFGFLMTCSSPPYVGVTQIHHHPTPGPTYYPSPNTTPSSPLLTSCNSACDCSTSKYDPVCGSDSLMYLSPCLAGCTSNPARNNFTQCSCIGEDAEGTADRTVCSNGCGYLIPYIVVQFLGIFGTFLATMPSVIASLRAVYPEERSLALGLQSIILRLFGTIPGPVLFGFFLDKACVLWEPSCDDVGSCLVYNNSKMSYAIMAICLICKVLSATLFGLGYLSSKRSMIADVGDEENDAGGEKTTETGEAVPNGSMVTETISNGTKRTE